VRAALKELARPPARHRDRPLRRRAQRGAEAAAGDAAAEGAEAAAADAGGALELTPKQEALIERTAGLRETRTAERDRIRCDLVSRFHTEMKVVSGKVEPAEA
jgi:hypothetical protein